MGMGSHRGSGVDPSRRGTEPGLELGGANGGGRDGRGDSGAGGAGSVGGPTHESRRRNAEQRAATLRADGLIGEVEPNRGERLVHVHASLGLCD